LTEDGPGLRVEGQVTGGRLKLKLRTRVPVRISRGL